LAPAQVQLSYVLIFFLFFAEIAPNLLWLPQNELKRKELLNITQTGTDINKLNLTVITFIHYATWTIRSLAFGLSV